MEATGNLRKHHRAGYETPIEVNAEALKSLIERTRGKSIVEKPAKLEAWRNGTAKTDVNNFPVEICFTDTWGLDVNDGRHRIALAAECGESVVAYIDERHASLAMHIIRNVAAGTSKIITKQ